MGLVACPQVRRIRCFRSLGGKALRSKVAGSLLLAFKVKSPELVRTV